MTTVSSPATVAGAPAEPQQLAGSSGAPVFGHTLQFLRDAVGMIDRLRAAHGPNFTMRMFGQEIAVLGSPDVVRDALMDREQAFSSRAGWDHAIGELFRDGLMLRDFDDHRFHRRIMQTAFRAEALRRYLDMMEPLIEQGLEGWGPSLHFYPAIKKLTLDVAAEVFLGIPLTAEADEVNRAFVDTNQASIALIKHEVPPFSYWRGMRGRRLLESFFFELLPQKRSSDGADMFAEFCRATELTYASRDRFPLCDAAFKEALRLHPPVPFIGRRTVKGVQVGGVFLPEDTPVSICSLVTHQLSEYWTEPRRFDPARFLEGRAEDKQHSHLYYPFGGGAHMCIGMHFAGLQVKAVLSRLLRCFEISVPAGYAAPMVPIPIPKPKDGLPVHLRAI